MAEADPVIASDTPATEEAPATAPKKRRWRRIALMAVVPLLLLIGGFVYWSSLQGKVATDNAYVQQDRVSISAEVGGQIVDVLAVRRTVLEKQPQHVRELIDGYMQARQLMQTSPQAAFAIMNQRLRLPDEQVGAMFDGLELPDTEENRRLLNGKRSPLSRTAEGLAQLMVKQKLMPAPPPLKQLTDPRFLPESS